MARLASQIKMGYYKTPPDTLRWLKEKVRVNSNAILLDPCCGEGEAIASMALMERDNHPWKYRAGEQLCPMYGIELDNSRERASDARGIKTLCGSIYDSVVRPAECFSLLWLNPPYEYEKGERMEYLFLQKAHNWLRSGGLLIYLVPEHILQNPKVVRFITRRYTDIRVYRFTRDEYPVFKQVALFGVKAEKESEGGTLPTEYPYIEDTEGDYRYTIPSGKEPTVFELKGMTEEEIVLLRRDSIKDITNALQGTEDEIGRVLSPIFPLKKGHLVSLLMSGVLNGRLTEDVIFKCFTRRDRTEHEIEEDGKNKKITLDTYVSGIRVVERGRWYDVV